MKEPLPIQPDPLNNEFSLALQVIEQTSYSLFLTGKAGTGKSTFLRYLKEYSSKKLIVLAPTGVAAMNVGGMTIHSFFQLPLRLLLPDDKAIVRFAPDSPKRKLLMEMDTLVIDEISMVRADIIDAIDTSMRRNLNPRLPFGGKQVVFIGDLFQLEPVVQRNNGEADIMKQLYSSPYFFEAHVFRQMNELANPLLGIELSKVYRQRDPHFIALLDKIRIGQAGEAELSHINSRLGQTLAAPQGMAITLATRNDTADRLNQLQLAALTTPEFTYEGIVEGNFDQRLFPTEYFLNLKEDAQVMFIRNDSKEGRWVNGTIGTVHQLTENSVQVKLPNGNVHEVEPVTWENIIYTYDKEKKQIEAEILGSYTQLPLRLAWAITIHKSQGLTFDQVILDLGAGTFAPGQFYVALSRCRSLEGIVLTRKVRYQDIIVSERVKQFAGAFIDQDLVLRKLRQALKS